MLTAGQATAVADAADVIGHRGARGDRPENTIPAFQYALARGATAVEADVGVTRDGRVVVHHDPRIRGLQCTGDAVGRLVKDLTLAQLRRLDCGTRQAADAFAATQRPVPGSHVPTLGQVLRVVRPTAARVNVELKRDPTRPGDTVGARVLARAVVKEVRANGMARRVVLQSFDWRVLREVARVDRRIRVVALVGRGTLRRPWLGGVRYGGSLTSALRRAGFDGVSLQHRLVTSARVAALHARGLTVDAYTVNDPARMQALLALGVDGIVTDYPERLAAVPR